MLRMMLCSLAIDAEETDRIADADTAETNARTAADADLQNNIDAEALNRALMDSQLQNNITTNTSAIDAEEVARIAADVILQDNIDDEESARIAAEY